MSSVFKILDTVSGVVLGLIAVLAPWMLGATTVDTIRALNGLCFLSGFVWLLQLGLKPRRDGVRFLLVERSSACWPMVGFWGLVTVLLAYVFCSALNPRSNLQYTFTPGYSAASGIEIEYIDFICWLPQTYDQGRTFRAFWKYLAIVLNFAAARDWLQRTDRRDRESYDGNNCINGFPSGRRQCLLWILAINSAAVSLVGMLQRLDGTDKLLWVFNNHINGGGGAFGPFPYQSNGAQYLNLMWPVNLGFWWVLRRKNLARRLVGHRSGSDAHVLLFVLAALAAAGVIVANSRGGFLVLISLLTLVLALAMAFFKRQTGFKIAALLAVAAVLGFGGWVGGDAMLARFRAKDLGSMSGRKLIYEDAERMAQDFAVFGSGAETFAPLYYFYRKKDPEWNAYAHDDYLETRITFGAVGFLIILLVFFSIWLVPFFGNGIPAPPEFIILIGVAMVGILVHAKFDLPFQIYSIHSQFVLLCAVLTTLKWQRR